MYSSSWKYFKIKKFLCINITYAIDNDNVYVENTVYQKYFKEKKNGLTNFN